jgi:hypothetical protein
MSATQQRWAFFNNLLILRDADHYLAAGPMTAHMRNSHPYGI